MNEGAVKLVRRFCKTLTTPEARAMAAKQMLDAWPKSNHRERGKLRALMERRIARHAA